MVGVERWVRVYDPKTQELLEECEGASEVTSIDVWDTGDDSSIVAGYKDGTIKEWLGEGWHPHAQEHWKESFVSVGVLAKLQCLKRSTVLLIIQGAVA